jgi:hypothetical protein
VYVKVYMKTGIVGVPLFVKDGFTDLRGCFDYASVSKSKPSYSSSSSSVSKFGILVLSKTHGSDVKEVNAPPEF